MLKQIAGFFFSAKGSKYQLAEENVTFFFMTILIFFILNS